MSKHILSLIHILRFTDNITDEPKDAADLCYAIGREPAPFFDTPSDGDCALYATAKSMFVPSFKGMSDEAMDICLKVIVSNWRPEVAKVITSQKVFVEALKPPAEGYENKVLENFVSASKTFGTCPLPDSPTKAEIVTAMSTDGKVGGPWYGALAMSALAFVIERNIFAISDGAAYFYTYRPGSWKKSMKPDFEGNVTTVEGFHTRFGDNASLRIPDKVFDIDTVVLMYTGNHYTFATPIHQFDSHNVKASFGFDRIFKLKISKGDIVSTHSKITSGDVELEK